MNGSRRTRGWGALRSVTPSRLLSKANRRVEPLGPWGDGRGEDVLAVEGEDVALRPLVAPELLVPDEDDAGRGRALLSEQVEAGARLLGEQADQAVAADERLEVEVMGRAGHRMASS